MTIPALPRPALRGWPAAVAVALAMATAAGCQGDAGSGGGLADALRQDPVTPSPTAPPKAPTCSNDTAERIAGVLRLDDAYVPDVRITVTAPDLSLQQRTDSDGKWCIEVPAPGDYLVTLDPGDAAGRDRAARGPPDGGVGRGAAGSSGTSPVRADDRAAGLSAEHC